MAKLKILLDDIGNLEVEGTPEELSNFLKTYKTPLVKKNNVVLTQEVETPTIESSHKGSSDDIEQISLPTVSEIVDYILTKPDFEYHTKELQVEFLGRKIKYREYPGLYGRFDRIIKSAKKHIEADHDGSWVTKTLPLEGKTHVNLYRFKKYNMSTQPLKDF